MLLLLFDLIVYKLLHRKGTVPLWEVSGVSGKAHTTPAWYYLFILSSLGFWIVIVYRNAYVGKVQGMNFITACNLQKKEYYENGKYYSQKKTVLL